MDTNTTPNQSDVTIARTYGGGSAEMEVLQATLGDFALAFDRIPGNDHVACQSCGATVTDWRTGAQPNVARHVAFHARLGY